MNPEQEEYITQVKAKRRSGGNRKETFIRLPGSNPFDKIPVAPKSKDYQFTTESNRFNVVVSETQGYRALMEDATFGINRSSLNAESYEFYGILDGHNGVDARDFVMKELTDTLHSVISFCPPHEALSKSYLATNQNLFKLGCVGGTTALAVLSIDPEVIHIANVGDSRALLCNRKGNFRVITKDHRPNELSEIKRLTALGADIVTKIRSGPPGPGKTISRLRNEEGITLGVSRCFGDFCMGDIISPVPDIYPIAFLNPDEYLILACDGLFDTIENEEIVEIVTDILRIHGKLEIACSRLRDITYCRKSLDNITIMMIEAKPTNKHLQT
jgi:serine/threonine protein phosphatase PrpC